MGKPDVGSDIHLGHHTRSSRNPNLRVLYAPYDLPATAVGNLVGVAPLIGAALGTLFGGWSSDEVAKVLALRNNGVYEPEFRLLVIIPAFVTIVIRGFGLGGAISSELSPVICGVFLAFINFAVGIGCTGIVSYTNDVF